MSSKYLYNQLSVMGKLKDMPRNMQHEPILMTQAPSMYQEILEDTPFVQTDNVKPGNKTICEVKFDSRDLRLERDQLIKFRVDTADGTNFPTVYYDAFSWIDFIEFEINGGADKIKWDDRDEMQQVLSEWVKDNCGYSVPPEQYLASWRRNFLTYTGTQVTNSAGVLFMLPLAPFLGALFKDTVLNGLLNTLKCTLRFVAVPSNEKEACRIAKSNTTAAAYTSSVSFNDIQFTRCYNIVGDSTATLRPALTNVMLPVSRFDRLEIDRSWQAGDTYSFKVSEICKRPLIQRIHVYARIVDTAYNSATACKKYSGSGYIAFKVAQLFGDRKELSFLSDTQDRTNRLRNYEIQNHLKRFGQYPATAWLDQTINDSSKYLVHCTTINFDDIAIESVPNHYEVINTSDILNKDYFITLEATNNVSATSTLVILVEYYDQYRFNANNQLVRMTLG
jgi:hypothetical protein